VLFIIQVSLIENLVANQYCQQISSHIKYHVHVFQSNLKGTTMFIIFNIYTNNVQNGL